LEVFNEVEEQLALEVARQIAYTCGLEVELEEDLIEEEPTADINVKKKSLLKRLLGR
jgi:hypothetical protein